MRSATAFAVPSQDREIVALLLAPFLIMAATIAVFQGLNLRHHLEALIARPVPPQVIPSTRVPARSIAATPVTLQDVIVSQTGALLGHRVLTDHPALETQIALGVDARSLHGLPPHFEVLAAGTGAVKPLTTSAAAWVEPVAPQAAAVSSEPPGSLARQTLPAVYPFDDRLAQAATAPDVGIAVAAIAPDVFPELYAQVEGAPQRSRAAALNDRCVWKQETATLGRGPVGAPTAQASTGHVNLGQRVTAATFGVQLAAAARGQLGEFVFYDDSYRSISYPHGDVRKLYGVCTDVIIRAYRALGVDLQVAVQQARVGSGDRNIDHRRTETLRRFFQRVGTTLPVTSFAEDYLPGDIVTYARPQNTGSSSRSHIAMVSDVIAPSGRPMIVHNRGWGPQLEDGLFVDRITGHYRFMADWQAPATPSGVVKAEYGLADQPMPIQVVLKPVGERRHARSAATPRLPTRAVGARRNATRALPRSADLGSRHNTARR